MLINTPERLYEALVVEDTNMTDYQVLLGLTNQDKEDCSNDRANMEVVLDNVTVMKAVSKSVTQTKDGYYKENPNAPVPAYPTITLVSLPFPLMNGDAFSRYANRKARAKLSPNYTAQIGLAMGYEDLPGEQISPDSLIAALKSYKDLGGYDFEASFTKQGQSAMLIQIRVKGTEKWFDAKTALQSPVTISVTPPQTEGASVEIEIRCRLMSGNTPVGQWSPIYSLTITA